MCPGVSKESENSLKPDFRTLFGLVDVSARKKYLAPPPPQNPSRRPPPPVLGYSIKSPPPSPSRRLGLPLPLPRAEKNKKYPKRPPNRTLFSTSGCTLSGLWGSGLGGLFRDSFWTLLALCGAGLTLRIFIQWRKVPTIADFCPLLWGRTRPDKIVHHHRLGYHTEFPRCKSVLAHLITEKIASDFGLQGLAHIGALKHQLPTAPKTEYKI